MPSASRRFRACQPALLVVTTGALALSPLGCLGSDEATALTDDPQLFSVDLADRAVRPLSNDETVAVGPTWSPDGTELAYVGGGGPTKLVIVNAEGSDRRTVFSDRLYQARALDWSPGAGTIALAAVANETAVTVGLVAADGSLARWVDSYRSDRSIDAPMWSPDGTRLAYARPWGRFRLTRAARGVRVDARPMKVVVASTAGGGPHIVPLMGEAHDPQWSPDGGSLLLTRFVDRRREQLVVVPTVGDTTRTTTVSAPVIAARAAWAPNGRQIAFAGVTPRDRRYHLYIVRADGAGRVRRLLAEEVAPLRPAWSPDGEQLAVADYEGHIRTIRVDDGRVRLLVDLPGAEFLDILWSPTGRALAFTARRRPAED